MAQIKNEQLQKHAQALETLRDYEIADSFYRRLSSEEANWQLADFFPPHPTDKQKILSLNLLNKGNELKVYIFEFATEEQAKGPSEVNIPVNQGRIEPYNQYGVEGRKIYRNGFSSLAYRKGKFVISIYGKDEKTAERLAGFVSDSISQ